MNDSERPEPATAAAPSHHPLGYGLLALLVLVLGFGGWGLWKTFAGGDGEGPRLSRKQVRIAELEQRVATLTRSDQISRDANRDLQIALAERDEEIAALRADVAFYERFVGSTAQRRGLSVHELTLRPLAGQAWHYTVTLTQNLNRGVVSSGRFTLTVEGLREGRLQRLDWQALRRERGAEGIEYSFRYFQQLEGEIVLPEGFEPLRIEVRLSPQGAAVVENSFNWGDAATARSGGGA